MTNVIDYEAMRDWRVGLFPAGTTLASALSIETFKQAGKGRTIDLDSLSVLPEYVVTTAAGAQDVVAVFGTVAVRYALNPL